MKRKGALIIVIFLIAAVILSIFFLNRRGIKIPSKGACIQNKETQAIFVVKGIGNDRLYAEAVKSSDPRADSEIGITFDIAKLDLNRYMQVPCP